MEYTDQSTLPRRILQLAGPIPKEFGLEYAISDHDNSVRNNVMPLFPRPANDRAATIYMKSLEIDFIKQRKVGYLEHIFHELDCLAICFKEHPPKPPVITPDIPLVETGELFPHIHASGAQRRPARPIGSSEKVIQEYFISTVKNSYMPDYHLELTVKGRGIFVEWGWVVVDCMVPNAGNLPMGTDSDTIQIHPQIKGMRTLAKFTRNILREALIPYSKELMSQDRVKNKEHTGKDSTVEDITHPCYYPSCISLNHVRAEPHGINVGREYCLSGSLCDCPSEYKCLCVGDRTTCETFLDRKLCSLEYAFHALAYLDSIENSLVGGRSTSEHKLECEIPNSSLGTVNSLHNIATYREYDDKLVRWVHSRTTNFTLNIVEAESF